MANGILSAIMPGASGCVATGRLNTAVSPGNPCCFSPVKTTHWVVTDFNASLGRLIVFVHLTLPGA